MASLAAHKTFALKALFGQMPQLALQQLARALSLEQSGPMLDVRQLAEAQLAERRLRHYVLEPIIPLFEQASGHPRFPRSTLNRLWEGLQVSESRLLAIAAQHMEEPPFEGDPHVAADALCRALAKRVTQAVGVFETLPDGCDRGMLAACLDMAPVVRPALPRLNEWINRPSDERRAALRVCYHRAVEIQTDGGPLFFQILSGHLERSWQVLTLISIVMDHPVEAYIAGSEFGPFGTRVLKLAKDEIEAVKAFDPRTTPARALDAARSVQIAHQSLHEMTSAIELSSSGPWGGQVGELRKLLISSVEAILKAWSPLLSQALPMNKASVLTPPFRATPKLSEDRAQDGEIPIMAWLNFVETIRQDSGTAGFGALRGKMLEGFDQRLQAYADDVLDLIKSGDTKVPERAASFVSLAADLAEARGDKTNSDLIRRRLTSVTDRHGASV